MPARRRSYRDGAGMAGRTARSHGPSPRRRRTSVADPTPYSPLRSIRLRGVRTHNLKGIDLDLPLHRLIVVTASAGPARARWRSTRSTPRASGGTSRPSRRTPGSSSRSWTSRTPTGSRASLPPSRSARSMAGTPAEARSARSPRSTTRSPCSSPGRRGRSAATAASRGPRHPGHRRASASRPCPTERATRSPSRWICAPRPIRRHCLRSLRAEGFTRLRVDGQPCALDDRGPALAGDEPVDVIVDRLVRGKRPTRAPRRLDRNGVRKGLGRCRILVGDESWTYIRGWRCSRCGTDHIEPQPNLFRFNSPWACPACEGLAGHRARPAGSSPTLETIREGDRPGSTPASMISRLLAVASSASRRLPFRRTPSSRRTRGRPGPVHGLDGFFGLEQGVQAHVRSSSAVAMTRLSGCMGPAAARGWPSIAGRHRRVSA